MKPSTIEIETKSLIARRWLVSRVVASWSSISGITVCRMPSLFDEIGMVLNSPGGSFFVRETQEGFQELFDYLGLEAELPTDWYSMVENGKAYNVNR